MSKKHDENRDLKLVSRVANIDYGTKHIVIVNGPVGIHTLGRLDFLHRCGWFISYSKQFMNHNSTVSDDSDRPNKERIKKHATLC